MPYQIAEAFVAIRPGMKGFDAELKSGVGGSVASLAKTFAGLAIGAAVLKSWRDGIAELSKAAAVSAQTANAIRATGGAANVTAAQVGELAERLSQMSGADDELIQQGANLILTFKNVENAGEGVNAIFDRATTAALDLSTAGFGSMESASIMLGKALNDPIAGLTALGRAGVTFSQAQKDTIAALVETGQTLEAQKVILAEVESQVGGSAKAFGETLPGQLAKAQVAMDNAKGAMLAGLAPALELVASGAQSVFGWIEQLPGPLRMIATLAIAGGAGFVALARPINEVITLTRGLRAATVATAAASVAAAGATGVMTTALEAEAVAAAAAAKATTGARVAMVGMLGPLAIAVTVVYGLAKAFQFVFDRGNDLGTLIDDLAADFGNLADDQLRSLVDQSGNLSDAFDLVAAKMLEADPTTAIGRFEQLRAKMVELGIDTSELDAFIADAAASQRDLNDAAAIGAGVVGDLDGAMDPLVSTADALALVLGFVADEQERVNSAIGDAFGAVTSAAEAALNHTAAYRKMITAIHDANTAKDDEKTVVDEVAVAHDEAIQSVIDLGEQTYATYIASGASAQAARDMQVAALRDVANNPEFANIKGEIEALIAKYDAVPDEIPTTITANATQAHNVLDALFARVGSLSGQFNSIGGSVSIGFSPSSNSGGSAIAAAKGYQGWIRGPQTFVVAEDGQPEYVSITPKAKMDSGVPSAWTRPTGRGSGGDTVINNYVTVPVTGDITPANAKRIGQDIGRGMGSAIEVLTRRRLQVAARTGG